MQAFIHKILTFKIFSNSLISFFWYAAIKFVIARISGSFLYLQAFKMFSGWWENQPKKCGDKQTSYGLASCPSKGFTSDSINILARTRYLCIAHVKIIWVTVQYHFHFLTTNLDEKEMQRMDKHTSGTEFYAGCQLHRSS
jgi:hypothetical protein